MSQISQLDEVTGAHAAAGQSLDSKLIDQALVKKMLVVEDKPYTYFDISELAKTYKLPFAYAILLENCLRSAANASEARELAVKLIRSQQQLVESGVFEPAEILFSPTRVLFQDFTGVPVFVDFASMRDAMKKDGADASKVNPQIPCTLVVDHSVIADKAGSPLAAAVNLELEARRNAERFSFLKWSASSFSKVQIVPPGQGICHQLNMERFNEVVSELTLPNNKEKTLCFDTLVGTDSHTTTANGLGVLGWGVGGIEAEAAALAQPISLLLPPVIELKLVGSLRPGVQGMDVALCVCELLRARGVVGAIIELTGEGTRELTATQRACIANMTPEYGATATLFPVDTKTLSYLSTTGRTPAHLLRITSYFEAQGLMNKTYDSVYTDTIELDLSSIEPSLAGPSRPQERVSVSSLPARVTQDITVPHTAQIELEGTSYTLADGSVALAAITSCTTATDPQMMISCGLFARKARELGLKSKPWIKTIFAPGSQATSYMLKELGLIDDLEALGFYTCGWGCMSCIGNSGDLLHEIHNIKDKVSLCSVLSGNRNFEGRISPDISQNYLCAPQLVLAYAIAGTMNIDLTRDALGQDSEGNPVFLDALIPTQEELDQALKKAFCARAYKDTSATLMQGSKFWTELEVTKSSVFSWDESSTYVRRAPYFDEMKTHEGFALENARVLAYLGDFVTTDHISPAGTIAPDSPAAKYLTAHGIDPKDFNTYGARRGNHEVMMRGTFANVKLQNKLTPTKRGGWTFDFVKSEETSIFDAAEHYKACGIGQVILAGKMYGSGSSRDWAGKGPALLGVKAVIAQSFERIHRSNLIQMGVVPLQFMEGQSAESLGLTGHELISVEPFAWVRQEGEGSVLPQSTWVRAVDDAGHVTRFEVCVRIDTALEATYLKYGGILPYVLRQLEATA